MDSDGNGNVIKEQEHLKYVVITKGYYKGCVGDIIRVNNGLYTIETYAGIIKFKESDFHYYDPFKKRIIKKKIDSDVDDITIKINSLPFDTTGPQVIPLKRKRSIRDIIKPVSNLSLSINEMESSSDSD
jgi:hypothetical protein